MAMSGEPNESTTKPHDSKVVPIENNTSGSSSTKKILVISDSFGLFSEGFVAVTIRIWYS
jgi:hypothetical protein